MKAAGLLFVFVVAKLAVLSGQSIHWSMWTAIAYFWQDALVALLFGAADTFLRLIGAHGRIRWALYWAVVAYAVVNIPVERALFTPLTWPMMRAARGPLADSFLHDATAANLALMALTIGVGLLPVWTGLKPCATKRDRLKPCATDWLLVACVPIVLAGPSADARADTLGMSRNVLTALLRSTRPQISSSVGRDFSRARTAGDWRRSRFDSAAGSDLSGLRGIAKDRNIIVVSLESTAAQYLGLYGAAQDPMPNLSALARNAVVFEHAYAAYPESIKGLFSVLCSGSPAFDTTPEQYEQAPCKSIASSLGEQRYRTGLFHSGRFSYLGMESIIDHRGFDTLEDAGAIGGNRNSSFGVDEPAAVDRMLSWIDAAPRKRPFFLMYLPIAGHHPYEAPGGGPFPSTDDVGRYRNALHDGDASLGKLMQGISSRGLGQNTVWILFGDHGEAFGQHAGNYGHTFFVYEENVHVPLVIAAPGNLQGQTRVSQVVSLLDTAPTILDLAGLTAPAEDQGTSMLGSEPQMALFFTDYSTGMIGLRDGPWKFIYELDSKRARLFDLAHDPLERADRSGDQSDRVRWYEDNLEAWAAAQKHRVTR